jgi:hypothetical protein
MIITLQSNKQNCFNMAENKNSIIVYADWMETFEALSDDEAGKLIKHFFRYVNDLNPVSPDRLTELSFIPIKNSLKRDLKRWENTLEGRSKAGKASAEARKKEKDVQQEATNSTNVDFVQQIQQEATNSTDSVSVSVSDSVTDIITHTPQAKDEFSDFPKNPTEKNTGLSLPEIKNGSVRELFKISKQVYLSTEQVETFWQIFKVQNFTGKKFYSDVGDVYSHFINWIKSQNVNKIQNGTKSSFAGNNQQTGNSAGGRINALKEW